MVLSVSAPFDCRNVPDMCLSRSWRHGVSSLGDAVRSHMFNRQYSNTRTSRFVTKRQASRSVISIRDLEENRDVTVTADCSNTAFRCEALNGNSQMLESYAFDAKEVDSQAAEQLPGCCEPGLPPVVRR